MDNMKNSNVRDYEKETNRWNEMVDSVLCEVHALEEKKRA